MRINFRYGAAVGILAAAFSTLGPVAAQAGQTPGAPVPTGAGAVSVQAPAAHLPGIAGKSVVLSSTFERSTWQRDNRIGAQREDNTVGIGQKQLGLSGQLDRMLVPQSADRCSRGYDRCCYGGGYGNCCGYGYGHGNCCGYGYNNGRCCGGGYGYSSGYGHGYGNCCGYGYSSGYGHGYGNCCGYGYNNGRCCYGGGYGGGYGHGYCCGYGYNNGRCVSHYSA